MIDPRYLKLKKNIDPDLDLSDVLHSRTTTHGESGNTTFWNWDKLKGVSGHIEKMDRPLKVLILTSFREWFDPNLLKH